MDTEVHGYILKEILAHFTIDENWKQSLIERTSYPDIEPKDNIHAFPLESSKYLVVNLLSGLQWIGNAIREMSKWGYEHSVLAVEKSTEYLEKSLALSRRHEAGEDPTHDHELAEAVAFTAHYVVDTGTPFHAKDFRDIFLEEVFTVSEARDGKPMVKTNLLKLFFNITYFFVIHNKFEHDIRRYWDKHPGYYEGVICAAVKNVPKDTVSADISKAPEEYIEGIKQELVDLKSFAMAKYFDLYNLYMEAVKPDYRFKNGNYLEEFMRKQYRGKYQKQMVDISTELLEAITPLLYRILRYLEERGCMR